MENNNVEFKLGVQFVDMIRKVVRKNKAGRHCYVYLPQEWDGEEIIILRSGKKSEIPQKVKSKEFEENPIEPEQNDILKEQDVLKEVGL